MEIFVPPVLAKPPLKLEDVTTEAATLKWLETWYEIMPKYSMQYDGDADESYFSDMWNSRVFTYTQGGIPHIRLKMQEGFKEHVLKTKEDVEAVEKIEIHKQPLFQSLRIRDHVITLIILTGKSP